MSAARKLALVLAESAQKASGGGGGSQRRSEFPHVQERPPRPSVLDLEAYPQEYPAPRGSCAPQWQVAAQEPADGHCCPHPFHFLPPYGDAEPPADADGRDVSCNFTPNVSPLGSAGGSEGSGRGGGAQRADPARQSIGVSTPVRPACPAHSPSASPVYVNADSINVFNFRAVLAETAMPASVQEVLPRHLLPSATRQYSPEEDGPLVYGIHPNRPLHAGRAPPPPRHFARPEPPPHPPPGMRGVYRQSSESRYSTFALQRPPSPRSARHRVDERLAAAYHRQQGPWQRSDEWAAGQPAIRRARSFHAPQVGRYALAGRRDDTRASSQRHQRLIQTSVHPVQPQFDRTPANYRHSPCPAATRADDPRFYNEEAFQRTFSRAYGEQPDYYNCSPRRAPPPHGQLCGENSGVFDSERDVYVPAEQGGRWRRQAASPPDGPATPTSLGSRDIAHIRSRSDPGNACLLNAGRAESRGASPATSPMSDHDFVGAYGRRPGAEPGPSRRIRADRPNPPLRKVPSLPEKSCGGLRGPEPNSRSHDQERAAAAVAGYPGVPRPGILRRSGRSQSTREHRHYHPHARSPLDPEPPGSAQLTRRTQSTKVRPSPHEYADADGCHAAPRLRPSRSGYLPSQGCMSPHGQRLLSKALGREAFHHAALRSEAGVYD